MGKALTKKGKKWEAFHFVKCVIVIWKMGLFFLVVYS